MSPRTARYSYTQHFYQIVKRKIRRCIDFNTAIQLHICGVVKKNGGECRDIV